MSKKPQLPPLENARRAVPQRSNEQDIPSPRSSLVSINHTPSVDPIVDTASNENNHARESNANVAIAKAAMKAVTAFSITANDEGSLTPNKLRIRQLAAHEAAIRRYNTKNLQGSVVSLCTQEQGLLPDLKLCGIVPSHRTSSLQSPLDKRSTPTRAHQSNGSCLTCRCFPCNRSATKVASIYSESGDSLQSRDQSEAELVAGDDKSPPRSHDRSRRGSNTSIMTAKDSFHSHDRSSPCESMVSASVAVSPVGTDSSANPRSPSQVEKDMEFSELTAQLHYLSVIGQLSQHPVFYDISYKRLMMDCMTNVFTAILEIASSFYGVTNDTLLVAFIIVLLFLLSDLLWTLPDIIINSAWVSGKRKDSSSAEDTSIVGRLVEAIQLQQDTKRSVVSTIALIIKTTQIRSQILLCVDVYKGRPKVSQFVASKIRHYSAIYSLRMFLISVLSCFLQAPNLVQYLALCWSGGSLVWAVTSEWVASWHAAVQTSALKRALFGSFDALRSLMRHYDAQSESIHIRLTTQRAKHPARRVKKYDLQHV